MNRSRISIGALGGTVSMTSKAPGEAVTPGLSADQLVASVPGLERVADLRADTILAVPSASLGFADLLACLAWADREVQAGAAGVVVTQGTDTLEESAFLLDLFWPHAQPLVFTGAMRPPQHAGADGPANLLAAVTAAAAPASRARGVQVVMNDVIHQAAWVRKAHALSVDAFVSPGAGPAGVLVEGRVHYFHEAPTRVVRAAPARTDVRVPLVEAVLGDDLEVIDLLVQGGARGVVVAGFGAGHVSFATAERVGRHAPALPMVIASRTGAGRTAAATYGFVGAETDLARRGAILAGWLDARKARLLLWTMLAGGASVPECAEAFSAFNG